MLEYLKEFIQRANAIPHTTPSFPGNDKYMASEKGKKALSKGWAKRNELMRAAREGLTEEEELQIKQFYKNRPQGHHVDHIVPISLGGLHRLDNLQYLPIEENRRKFNKLLVG